MTSSHPAPSSSLGDALDVLRRRNLRDLAGLKTRDDREITAGRLFRCGNPSRFDSAERTAFDALGLRTIVDVRTTAEQSQRKMDPPPGARVVHLPLFEDARPNWYAPPDQTPFATAARYLEMLLDGIPTIVSVIGELSEPGAAPFLVHCAAGRDRTGIVIACILDLLDVVEEDIAADYAQSDALVWDGHRAHPATIVTLLELVRERHGSTRQLLEERGITRGAVDRLKHALLAPR